MSSSLQNKLLSFQVEPPPAVWESIETRLDAEFNASDAKLADQLAAFDMVPPAAAWERISAEISSKPAVVRQVRFKRIAIAAIFCGLIALASVFILRRPERNAGIVRTTSSVQPQDSNPSSTEQSIPDDIIVNNRSRAPEITATISSSKTFKQALGHSRKFTELNSPSFLQTVAVNDRIQISAPPLRDDRGQIILDLALICDPNLPYLFVTAPNGSPTRISDKFRECIPYLNNHLPEETAISNPCLEQFKAWRNKLLKEVAFIPSANNFFDIFELQELIEE